MKIIFYTTILILSFFVSAFASEIKLPIKTSIGVLDAKYIDYRKGCGDSGLKKDYQSYLTLNNNKLNKISKTLYGPIQIFKLIEKPSFVVVVYGSHDECYNRPEFPIMYVAKINTQGGVIVTNTGLTNYFYDENYKTNINIIVRGDNLIFPSVDEGPKIFNPVYNMNTTKLNLNTKLDKTKFEEFCKHMYDDYSSGLDNEKCFRVDKRTSKKVVNTNIIELLECSGCRGQLAFYAKSKSELSRFNSFCVKSCRENAIFNYAIFKKEVCNLR